MTVISFMSANYVARQLGYHITEGWMQGDNATNEYFKPLDTFPERFGQILSDVKGLGFDAIDIWVGHLNPAWATEQHWQHAKELLSRHTFTVSSLAGFYGSTPAEAERYCQQAAALGTHIIGGNIPLLETDRPALVSILKNYDVRLGIENHPEKTGAEILAKVGDGSDGYIGSCIDTGWFGTHAYSGPKAIEEVGAHLVHIHLKDVKAPGGHKTCRLGEGCVDIPACVAALKRIGYAGGISIEHEPDNFDPSEDVRASAVLLRQWLA